MCGREQEGAGADPREDWCDGNPANQSDLSFVCEHGRLLPHVIEARVESFVSRSVQRRVALMRGEEMPTFTDKETTDGR